MGFFDFLRGKPKKGVFESNISYKKRTNPMKWKDWDD